MIQAFKSAISTWGGGGADTSYCGKKYFSSVFSLCNSKIIIFCPFADSVSRILEQQTAGQDWGDAADTFQRQSGFNPLVPMAQK